MSEEEKLDPHLLSKVILDTQVNKIRTSPYSQFIPIGAQVAERVKQEARAFARFLKRQEQINASTSGDTSSHE